MSVTDSRSGLAAHGDLAAEQAYVDQAYECLAAMRERAEYLKGLGYMGGNVHADTGLRPEAAGYWDRDKQQRIDDLADTAAALCFGRIDRADGGEWYIGRRHVEDSVGEPVVTDWRASVATPFYRATVVDPMGLALRRRFLIEGRTLSDLFDENLADPDSAAAGAYVPDPLLAEVTRSRTGEMRDIVATIQAEQDVIIRAPLEQCTVVQGGPGTGKTAVGLHRAAFLLYEHRELLERQRLLIVGPNRIFLRYIAQVLPSLGEVASTQLTIEGLAGAAYTVRAEDSSAAARVKGDGRMAEVVRRAVLDQVSRPTQDQVLTTRYGSLVLPAPDLAALIDTGMERVTRINDYRAVLRQHLVDLAWRVHLAKPSSDVTDREGLEADLRASAELKAGLDKMWPNLTAAGVIRRLLGNQPARTRATAGLLRDTERDRLARKAAAKVGEERWTRADLALLDEAEDLISGRTPSYGHIVVDEAQDLSTMELRMIARRSRSGSMTVLGDLAQATAPGALTDWNDALVALGAADARYEELTVGYRVPEPILSFANRLLPEAAPGIKASTSVRQTGSAPHLVRVAASALGAEVAAAVRTLLTTDTSVGVVVPDSLKDPVAAALQEAGIAFIDGQRTLSLGDHVTLLPPAATKGLEFDAVIVAEPVAIVDEEHGSLKLLYVVLTRAVQHLTIVHSEPLPAALTH
ncbi:MAG TPA: AAA family ATPase [Acidimicrobiales bacterium]|nr:AAA family ATPase [Acidimicrobiales bacterium]